MMHLEILKTSKTVPWEASFAEASGKGLPVSKSAHIRCAENLI